MVGVVVSRGIGRKAVMGGVSGSRREMKTGHPGRRAHHFQAGRASALESHRPASIRTAGLPGDIEMAAVSACWWVWVKPIGLGRSLHSTMGRAWCRREDIRPHRLYQGLTLISIPMRFSMSHARSYSSSRRGEAATTMAWMISSLMPDCLRATRSSTEDRCSGLTERP